jgi:hypothetical protein
LNRKTGCFDLQYGLSLPSTWVILSQKTAHVCEKGAKMALKSLSFIGTCTIFRKTTISTKCTIWAIYLAAQQYFKITICQPITYFTPIIVQNSLKLKL